MRVAKNMPQLIHRGVDIGVVIDARVARPQTLPQNLTRDYLTGMFRQNKQRFNNFALNSYA